MEMEGVVHKGVIVPDNAPALAEGTRVRIIPELVKADEPPSIEKRFRDLVREWKDETRFLSSIHDIVSHPAYLRIIGMGNEALPLLVNELRREPDHWFVAMQAITGANPIPPSARGDVEKMTQAWLS